MLNCTKQKTSLGGESFGASAKKVDTSLYDKIVNRKANTTEQTSKVIIQKPLAETLKMVMLTERPANAMKCSCSKSKCLKLYCECFAKGIRCGDDCGCTSCCNTHDNLHLIEAAKKDIMKRDPRAFEVKKKVDSNVHPRDAPARSQAVRKDTANAFNWAFLARRPVNALDVRTALRSRSRRLSKNRVVNDKIKHLLLARKGRGRQW